MSRSISDNNKATFQNQAKPANNYNGATVSATSDLNTNFTLPAYLYLENVHLNQDDLKQALILTTQVKSIELIRVNETTKFAVIVVNKKEEVETLLRSSPLTIAAKQVTISLLTGEKRFQRELSDIARRNHPVEIPNEIDPKSNKSIPFTTLRKDTDNDTKIEAIPVKSLPEKKNSYRNFKN